MGHRLSTRDMNCFLERLQENFDIYAPVRMVGGNTFSDLDCIRYSTICSVDEIIWDEKSHYSFKECLLPLSQVLFYYTENQVKEPDPAGKGAIIFLRSCDLHAVKRLDEIYLHNGPEDYYYRRIREQTKFVLMGCTSPFTNCFCTDMGTDQSDNYDLYVHRDGDQYFLDNRTKQWGNLLQEFGCSAPVTPVSVQKTRTCVSIPDHLTTEIACAGMWDEYDARCINCGRCNFVCPTCTCYTMQDVFYTENGRVGERRRVHASCMVDGFTDMAGGHSYRQKNGQRMRFRVLHKVYDYKKRFGYHMCVGCGRCDDICPEYISFSGCVSRLKSVMEEVIEHAAE